MGYLVGYNNITKNGKQSITLPPQEVFHAFQQQVFDLIFEAYKIIKTSDKIEGSPDETVISISLFLALNFLSYANEIPLTITIEKYEISELISLGKKKIISSKRFDIFFESWNSKSRIEYGIESKLLIENNCWKKVAKRLINEYVSDAGMGKYINHIYKKRGCMMGYIVEGNSNNVVQKINKRIEKVLNKDQSMINMADKFDNNNVYVSKHAPQLLYDLYHLLLDFT